jgi:DNA-binding protein HU-beta
MNKSEWIAIAAERAGVPKKDAERVLNAALEVAADALEKGEKVMLSGFGVLEVKERQARVGRNPKTKESVEIPASKSPVFKASPALKDRVAK